MDVKDITYHDVEGVEDFQYVVGVELGGGYDWDSLEAWYSPGRRQFFWLEGSGCSCNSLGDEVSSIEHFEFGSRESLANAVRAKYAGAYGAKPTDLILDLATVKKFRAATS